MVKEPPASAETQETQLPSLGREEPPRKGNGNPFQSACLENPMDPGTWKAAIHRVAKSWTQLRTEKHFHFLGP